jgi:hypothetical protein
MAAKLTTLSQKIAIQLHLVAESCTICSSRSRRPARKLLDTPSYLPPPHPQTISHGAECFFLRSQVTQLVKKFPAFYGTWRFITLFTTARNRFLSWARWIHSTSSRHISLRSSIAQNDGLYPYHFDRDHELQTGHGPETSSTLQPVFPLVG